MPANPRHLVLNLLLGHGGVPLAAREAVSSCRLFGIPENSLRVALVRLVAAGLIEAVGRGAYRLGPNASSLAADVAGWRQAEQRVRPWRGDWIAVHTGGLARGDRAAQHGRRRALGMLGMRELDPGLHLRPDNLLGGVDAVRDRLHALGLEPQAAVFVARGFDAEREQRARLLWDADALSHGYRQTRQQLDRWLGLAPTLANDIAAREAYVLGHDAIRQLVFDPWLPAPLVDAEARRQFVRTVHRFDDAGQAIWRRFLRGNASPRPATRTRRLSGATLETLP